MKTEMLKAIRLFAIVLLGCYVTVLAGDVDLVTHMPVTPLVPPVPIPEGDAQFEILWDLTHGVYLNFEPSGKFSDLTTVLAGVGFTMNTTDQGVQNIDLTVYDVVVINLTSAWSSEYQAAEVTALVNYVNQGGGLLIAGGNSGCPNGNINPVSQAFGTTCGVPSLEPSDLSFSNFLTHQIFDGISMIYFRATGALTCVSPSVEAAWSPIYSEVLITLVDPSSRIAVLGTSSGMSNNYFSMAHNIDFAVNLFHYLAGSPIPLEHITWGAIKTLDD